MIRIGYLVQRSAVRRVDLQKIVRNNWYHFSSMSWKIRQQQSCLYMITLRINTAIQKDVNSVFFRQRCLRRRRPATTVGVLSRVSRCERRLRVETSHRSLSVAFIIVYVLTHLISRAFQFGQKSFDSIRFGNLINLPLVH